MVQRAVQSAFKERFGSTSSEVIIRLPPRTEFYSARGQDDDKRVLVDPYDPEQVREVVMELARVLS